MLKSTRYMTTGHPSLPAICVGASVGHGQHAGASVLELEVLVSKLLAVDGLPTSAVACSQHASVELARHSGAGADSVSKMSQHCSCSAHETAMSQPSELMLPLQACSPSMAPAEPDQSALPSHPAWHLWAHSLGTGAFMQDSPAVGSPLVKSPP